jgi:metal-dependent amidase/aminoacylase/carboxypeptidase family protein
LRHYRTRACKQRSAKKRNEFAPVHSISSSARTTEDFAYMLEACSVAFINIGNAGSVGSCPVHNPHYDFNDEALPIGASLFARLVEKKLPRLSTT